MTTKFALVGDSTELHLLAPCRLTKMASVSVYMINWRLVQLVQIIKWVLVRSTKLGTERHVALLLFCSLKFELTTTLPRSHPNLSLPTPSYHPPKKKQKIITWLLHTQAIRPFKMGNRTFNLYQNYYRLIADSLMLLSEF